MLILVPFNFSLLKSHSKLSLFRFRIKNLHFYVNSAKISYDTEVLFQLRKFRFELLSSSYTKYNFNL